MKQLLLITILFFSVYSHSQTVYLSGLSDPNAISFHGDTMYFSETSGDIYKVNDLVNPNPTLVISGTTSPIEMKVFGDELYIAEQTANKISKIDLTNPSPTVQDVVTGIGEPTGIAFKDSIMYFADITSGETKTFDLTNPVATPQALIDGYFGIGMVFDADTLYIASGLNNSITKHDMTDSLSASAPTTIASGLNFPAAGAIYNGEFYFTESSGNSVGKVLMESPYSVTNLFSGNFPTRLAIHNGILYVVLTGANTIVTYDLTANINELTLSNKELIKVVDLMGREVEPQKNIVLIYVYSDGTTERIFEFE